MTQNKKEVKRSEVRNNIKEFVDAFGPYTAEEWCKKGYLRVLGRLRVYKRMGFDITDSLRLREVIESLFAADFHSVRVIIEEQKENK